MAHLTYHKSLDGIRGIAILLVLAFHVNYYSRSQSWAEAVLNKIFTAGWTGVDLFFVLSGFLITRILLHSRGESGYFNNFYARRALRIFPLYYVTLAFFFLLLPALISTTAIPGLDKLLEQQWRFWLYVQNFSFIQFNNFLPADFLTHTWSLAIEEQFYLFWPVIIYFLSRERLKVFCLAVLGGSFLLRSFFHLQSEPPAVMLYNTLAHMDALAAGALAATIHLTGPLSPARRRQLKISAAITGLVLAAHWAGQEKFLFMPAYTYVYGTTLLYFLFGSIILLSVDRPDTAMNRCFNLRVLGFFGKYSYAIYLFHWPVLYFLMRWPPFLAFLGQYSFKTFILLAGSYMSITVFLALVSWHILERPFLKLKSRF